MNNKKFTKLMQDISNDKNATKLKKAVAITLIDQLNGYDNPLQMFQDLNHGCQSGIVASLIYYSDTYAFAKEHIEDILELLQEAQQDYDLKMPNNTDLLNWLAWFGFEETAFQIGRDLYPNDL